MASDQRTTDFCCYFGEFSALLSLLCFVMILLLLPQPLYAQNSMPVDFTSQNQVRFERLSIEQGLSQSTVASVVQGSDGFLWFGTHDGLNRFDGYHFKVFKHDPDDPQSLPDNYVERLYRDRKGRLWVGTHKGLSLFDSASESFTNYLPDANNPQSLGEGIVISIFEDQSEAIWVASLGNGLSRLDQQNGTFTHYRHDPNNPQSLSDNKVYTVFEDHSGVFWVGTRNGGLNRFDGKTNTFRRFRHQPNDPNSLSHDRVYKLFEDSENTLWVLTRGGGLNRFNAQDNTFTRYQHNPKDPNSLSSDLVFAMAEDQPGFLWVGTRNGLNRFDTHNGTFVHFEHDPDNQTSLSDGWVMSLHTDNTGILWVGTHGGGLNKFNPSLAAFGHFRHHSSDPYSLSDDSVWSFFEDRQGYLWVGTQDGGLNRYDPKQQRFSHFRHNPEDPSSVSPYLIGVIFEDNQGTLWVGSQGGGLSRFNAKTQNFSHFLIDSQATTVVDSNQVYAIADGKPGKLWIGTRNGLGLFDKTHGTFKRYLHNPDDPSSLSENWAQALLVDDQGVLWIGTHGGLNRFEAKSDSFTRYLHQPKQSNSLSGNVVFVIHQSDDGLIWLGLENGLNRFDRQQQTFTLYGEKQGLSNGSIYGLLGDKHGDLWLSTNRGLNRFNPRDEKFTHYFVSDGLQSNEFRQGGAFVAADGQMFFSGTAGFNAFYPDNIKDDVHAPVIAITDFLLFNQSVPLQRLKADSPLSKAVNQSEGLTLDHHSHVFSFEFAALHFANPLSNQYAYKLEGFDENWITTGADKRFATYTNIPAGDYIFHIKGSNKDGVWNTVEKQLSVTITPAPWRTWWAYLAYFLAVLILVEHLWRERYRRMMIHKKAADQLKDSEERLSLALWGSGEQLWDWDIEKEVVHRRNMLADFDLPVLQKIDTNVTFGQLIHPDDLTLFLANLQRHMDGDSDNFESTHRLKNAKGEWIWVMEKGRVTSRDVDGQVLRMSGVLMNVNELYDTQKQLKELNENLEKLVAQRTTELQNSLDELKQTQNQLVQSEKMAALSYLVAGVAHEVNTPLGICVTVVSLQLEHHKALARDFKDGKVTATMMKKYLERSGEQLNVTQRNILRSADLVNSFKQVAVDQTDEKIGQFTFDKYLKTIINSVSAQISRSKLSLNLAVAEDIKLTTYPGIWVQIITSLIDNSIKHGFSALEGGQITITAEQRHARFYFTYTDNGKGMSQEQVKRVFDPFYTTNRDKGGMGLGMHIVFNQIVQQLEGQIECSSEAGVGVTFSIDTPVVIEQTLC